MASTLAALLVLLFSLLLLHGSEADDQQYLISTETMNYSVGAPTPSPLPHPIDCGAECGRRCSETKRPNLCKRACGSCCKKCSCVPPGTSGNLDACHCYANLTTHEGVHKCP
ncbi:gibberellin-regulated protein 1-like [Carica papaya]|uniref:gibberellin-regulated protein 1-like n=1 Tax=Carica papaya TaxID=3649 RepID=UPI000B8CD7ED|nr:gibberellin-regulated protein 1-like [Carica papaya]